jgi:hypothetical protein
MVTLGVFKSSSGTIKKMLHAPSLKIFAVKEVPISNVQVRQMLIDWIATWQHNCCFNQGKANTSIGGSSGFMMSESFVKILTCHWNTPEGCVSVVMDFNAHGSLGNL